MLDRLLSEVKKLRYIGSGSYSSVYDAGDFVVKVSRTLKRMDKHEVRAVRAMCVQTVRMMRKMREKLGPQIPHTWYLYGGLVGQEKIAGLNYYDLADEARGKASVNLHRLRDEACKAFPTWHFDTNTDNFFFDSNGEVIAWVDPFTPHRDDLRKVLRKNDHIGYL